MNYGNTQWAGGDAMLFEFSYKPYIALIGDIKSSKEIEERKKVQDKLKSTLDKINQDYKDDISSKFIITLGDEFQGLLKTGKNVIRIVEQIQLNMHPIAIRFGIGIGAVTTDINYDMSIGADGPAYYKAREAIEYLKGNELKNKTYVSDIRLEVDEDTNEIADMINTILSLLTVLKENWTDRQREIILDFIKNQDSQKKTAKRLGIVQSTVQRGLKSGNYYTYKEAIDTVNHVFSKIN